MKSANDYFIRSDIERWTSGWDVLAEFKVLDLGCGQSPYLELLSRGTHRAVFSVDIERRGASTAVLANANALPFTANLFDKVLLAEVLEHTEFPERVIRELSRVTKVGGALFLTVPLHYAVHEIPFDYFRPTEFGIRALLERCGFEVVMLARRGGVFCVLFTMLLQLASAAIELPARLPLVGAIYNFLICRPALKIVEMLAYLVFVTSNWSSARFIPLTKLRGASRAFMLWTNGYCVHARKIGAK